MSRGTESNTTGQRTLTGKRIVVTGGTGLVGSHLVAELLRQDCRVRLLVREGSRFDRLNATLQRMGTAVEAGRLERYEAALNNRWNCRRFAGGRCGFSLCGPRVVRSSGGGRHCGGQY